ncbi:ABC-type multidrug transport system ATPase and permease components-like protein [Methylobacterium sp. 4-46]|uniref:ATP-binding cassette domain-containing protein n=1 Tax=unclassified Methylobacterium TaxID=2615210 RepID=UPI000165C69D|nr:MULTISPECIES: ATP-binding cassette domain-containing protein [Methylobacterium]ACA16794.1 ABC-type multidrug transport system ATPase and permease components-like protein [Methylobacterium sp. 4-46]WFT82489.1 ABC transporter ATP-binding protein [Methylobacterium nodulans]
MERDPIAFAWRSAPRQHAVAVAVALGAGLPVVALGLALVRDLVDELLVAADPGHGPLLLLRIVLPLPERLGGPLTLLPGWPMSQEAMTLRAVGGLALVGILLAGLGWITARLCFSGQGAAVERLRRGAAEAILRSGPAGRDEARALAGQVGEGLRAVDALLAVGLLVPALTGGAVLLALGVAAAAAPRLVPAVAVSVVAAALARALLIIRANRQIEKRRDESLALERALTDLVRRLPAVRAHGTAAFERARLGHAALAARRGLARAEASLARARAPALALFVLLPALVLATALWHEAGPAPPVTAGALAAAFGALALAASLLALLLRQNERRRAALPAFGEIGRLVAALEARAKATRRLAPAASFPRGGPIVLAGAAAYDPASGERLIGLDLTLPMPGHVAILGRRGSGGRVLAALVAGQLEPTTGQVTYAGTDLRALDPSERARRIAFAGDEPVLVAGSLLQNLLYGDLAFADGSAPDPDAPPPHSPHLEERLVEALAVTGLDALVRARGLASLVAPSIDPDTAAAIVATRSALREALTSEQAAHLIEPFDPHRYNAQATVGENLLFGEPVGRAFAEERLAGHPFTRAVLEAEGLTRPMIEMGLAIARATVEIFADLPDDHPLFDAFSLFPAAERGFFEDLVARQPEATGWRRGPAGQRDRARLIGLALRYSESRHRFGLIDAAFEERLVAARRTFAALLPANLRASVEFYDPAKVTIAASLEENLLFGRIAGAEAGAGTRVRAVMQRVLAERGLERTVYRFGLSAKVDPRAAESGLGNRDAALTAAERSAIDLARCLVRQPDILVVGLALDDRSPAEIRAGLARLRAARAGRGLVVCLPDAVSLPEDAPFDAVVRAERNTALPIQPSGDASDLSPLRKPHVLGNFAHETPVRDGVTAWK